MMQALRHAKGQQQSHKRKGSVCTRIPMKTMNRKREKAKSGHVTKGAQVLLRASIESSMQVGCLMIS